MVQFLICLFVALPTLGLAGGADAQAPATGNLVVQPSGSSACPSGGAFFEGQDVRLVGSGFAGGAAITIYYGESYDALTAIDTTNADGSGALDEVVTIPSDLAAPVLAVMEARGQTASGKTLYLSVLLPVNDAAGPDTDMDLLPDICDNCPNDPNPGQENDDGDVSGNVCDPCPLDSINDSDGDGLCGDVDPCPFDADNDVDGDGICGDEDNCPGDSNANQYDQDRNGIGDVCQTAPTCSDGIDNDGDGLVDHPADPGCVDADDATETDAAFPCDDGIDNDADALADYRSDDLGDPGCGSGTSPSENPECDDGIDNDGDGDVDWDGDYVHTPDSSCGGDGSGVSE